MLSRNFSRSPNFEPHFRGYTEFSPYFIYMPKFFVNSRRKLIMTIENYGQDTATDTIVPRQQPLQVGGRLGDDIGFLQGEG